MIRNLFPILFSELLYSVLSIPLFSLRVKEFSLKLKDLRSIGSVGLCSILGVPFLVEIAVMMSMVLTTAYRGVYFIVLDDSF